MKQLTKLLSMASGRVQIEFNPHKLPEVSVEMYMDTLKEEMGITQQIVNSKTLKRMIKKNRILSIRYCLDDDTQSIVFGTDLETLASVAIETLEGKHQLVKLVESDIPTFH